MNSIPQKSIDRFWGKVDKESSTTFYNGTRCWEWTASKDDFGYGTVSILGKVRKTHRVSWMISSGDIPNSLWVLHHCDNPACVRPDHLFLGTRQDNMDDMMRKGRHVHPGAPRGKGNGNYKFPEELVNEIRRLYKPYSKDGNNGRDLAKRFGVSFTHVSNIVNGGRRRTE